MNPVVALSQKLLKELYIDLDREEAALSSSNPYQISHPINEYKELFAELYRVPGKGVRLVGPVGERPLHVCLLRAGKLPANSEMRAGLIDGVK